MDKDDLFSLLGKMSTKAELALKVIEEVDCGKFICKKINYSTEAGEIIPAFLYIPKYTNDRWSQNIEEIFEYAKSAFVHGKLERKIYSGKHMFSKEMRSRAYDFLARYLN